MTVEEILGFIDRYKEENKEYEEMLKGHRLHVSFARINTAKSKNMEFIQFLEKIKNALNEEKIDSTSSNSDTIQSYNQAHKQGFISGVVYSAAICESTYNEGATNAILSESGLSLEEMKLYGEPYDLNLLKGAFKEIFSQNVE